MLRDQFLSHIVTWDEAYAEWLALQRAKAQGPEPGRATPSGLRPQNALRIAIQHQEGVTVLFPAGRLTLGDGDQELGEVVGAQLERGARKILIDFTQVSYLDSAGLGELVGCFTATQACGGELKVCGLNTRVLALLTLSSLNGVFGVKGTQAEALAAF